MDQSLPSVTVLIAAPPGMAQIDAVTAGLGLDYPRERLEIIVARGRQPSVQRNAAMRAARGDLIYFLDNDSVAPRENLRLAAGYFADPAVKMVGGPNICPDSAPFIERVFALVHASWLAFFSSRARYSRVGAVRDSSEKELILCNLIARRDAMIELGGFNEALYPNEENALMDELLKRGGRLIYDPAFIVYRRPRRSVKSFCRMLFNYGRGRAEQFRVNPTLGSAANFVPPLFCVYLLAAVVLEGFGLAPAGLRGLIWLPLAVYFLAVLAQAAVLVPVGGLIRSVCAIPGIMLTHIVYGIGFWRGLFTSLNRDPAARLQKADVVLETVPL
jgi:succinoglycan biosynthesis protein ExoA